MNNKRLKISVWDRFLLSIAPGWGLRRIQAKAAARHYEAAGDGRRTSGWHRSGTDANTANSPALAKLRELSRDLRRNNGWAKRAIRVIGVNTVGWGIEAKVVANSEDVAKKAADLWKTWSNSPRCDYDGRMPFTGLQRLVMETVVESGEALVIREAGSELDGLKIPLRVRVLEPDYLDTTRDGMKGDGGGAIINGVEFDNNGRRLAYWLYKQHPGSMLPLAGKFESTRVLARDVIHVYLVERPGQVRGVPWLASAIAKLNDFDDYDDAVLMQQKIAACFGAFVQDVDGAGGSPLGDQDEDDEQLETLEPGHIQYLPPGKTITFANPPSTSNHDGFTTTSLRRIAVSLGVTYEDLTGDYSRVNFSSARMGRLAHWSNVHDWRWNVLIPQFCEGVWAWAMEIAAALNSWPEVPTASWSPPPMPMLEPDKEGLAYTRMLRSGTKTLYGVLRELGEDPVAHLQEIAAGNSKLDELGIWLDSDPRRTSAAGLTQERTVAGGENESSDA